MRTALVAFTCIALLQIVCGKQQEELAGTVKDYTGLDGCSMVIVLDSGEVLEPAELPGGVTLVADRRVMVSYKPLRNKYSICMVGPIVKITSLRYL